MYKKLSKDFLIYGLGNFLIKFIAFLVFPIYTHIFTTNEFGVISLVTVLSTLIGYAIDLGISNAIIRFNFDEEDQKGLYSTTFWMKLVWSILFTLLILVFLSPIRDWINDEFGIFWIYIVLALAGNIPKQFLLYSTTIFRANFLPWKYTTVVFLDGLLGIGIGFILIVGFDMGLYGFFIGNLIGGLFSVPFALILIWKFIAVKFDKKLAVRIFKFGYPLVFSNLAYWLFSSTDRWMLSEFTSNDEVGVYSVAFKFATIIHFFSLAFAQAWQPSALKLQKENSVHKLIFSKSLTVWFFVLTIVGSYLCVFGFEIVSLTTPKAYWSASNMLIFITIATVFGGTQVITSLGIIIKNKTKYIAYAAWLAAILNIFLNFIFIPIYGGTGAALASLLAYFSLVGSYLFWSQKFYPIPLEKGKIIIIILIILLTILMSFLFNDREWTILVFTLKVIYCLLITYLGFAFKIIDLNKIKSVVLKQNG